VRINDLQDCLPKVLLFKAFDESISVMEFVASSSGKPSCGFLFHQLDLGQSPVMSMSTYIQMGSRLEPCHLILRMQRIPLAMTRHIMSGMYSALSSVWKNQSDSSFPIFSNSVGLGHPFKWITSTRPHVMVAANENHRIHFLDQPLN
jgi:hypothetical protein